MLETVAIRGYRSLRDVVVPLRRLTVFTGANGAGKSSLYRALRLLADCGRGEVISSLAREGGVESALWAGPENLAGARRTGVAEGGRRTRSVSIELGYASDDFGYLIDLGLPQNGNTAFYRDPEIKREIIFAGAVARPAATLVRRVRAHVEVAGETPGRFDELARNLATHRSVLNDWAGAAPELAVVRERLRDWRFYDGFRADGDAPARRPQVGTRTPVLANDGADLAAAVQTILETGTEDLAGAVDSALDGATVSVSVNDGLFDLLLHQRGMLRPLRSAELSDGTLRFLLWTAALLSPEPPSLMVLNEPETSLHPELVTPLAQMIIAAATRTQVVVVTHSAALRSALGAGPLGSDADAWEIELVKDWGETTIAGQGLLATPRWDWGSR
ncbi:ATP-binding protein [Mycolicibacterium duvalii]|uniref:ATP-binding protein n=1 Tax=Mycolicibacterium duvalii TaxID=39688 RepID=A0A7I7K1U2_9MYCO|nr:AAA family ATPase [Mycolicibacterium duvalii]MCV7369873.1 AAA family ATPase [Mycolicibacterium duvalii]PEG35758.1 ATP-binding protein [Mycolicibacterium duvalii]BBX17604.1 ATP-binding protein [Mycolicibacterium duvalii]